MGRLKSSEAGTLVFKRGIKSRDGKGLNSTATKTGFDGLAELPWRKTASIFKQPVTLVHTTSKETQKMPQEIQKKLMSIAKYRDRVERPRQMFWAKSLEGLRAMIPVNLSDKIREPEQSAHIEQHLALASKIEPTVGVLNEEAVAATLCSSLQLCNGLAIIGQQATKKQIDTSPLTAINFSQPLVQIPAIAEHDVAAQERRVLDARKRLQELRKSFALVR
ncbi:p55-binding region of methyl-CpG-binding domain proteins MBD domain-containing protein [Ditylenchus destructor]|nr:p55-binding region of methyl-CpG-binding domain proteins MBD domain-containing protein [Ditylenchus destructor]